MRREHLVTFAAVLGLCITPAAASTPEERARIELATYGALYGAGAGLYIGTTLDLGHHTWWPVGALGAAAGWGAWEAARAGDLQPGQASMIGSATGWTMLHTLLVGALIRENKTGPKWLPLATGAAAAGVAYGLTPYANPSEGDVSLVNSGGLWGPLVLSLGAGLVHTGVTAVFAAPDPDPPPDPDGPPPGKRSSSRGIGPTLPAAILVTSALGLGAGAAIATRVEPTRYQVLALDAGLLGGLVVGGVVAYGLQEVSGVSDSKALVFGALLAGMVGGAAVAIELAGFDGAAGQSPAIEPAERSLRRERRAPPPAFPLWIGSW